jgi:2-oxoglutarate dehydrogenase E2 component (dihydrolipoamide succinyltransferase)
VLRWCKAAGDAVRKDEPLLELETDKVTVEIPSPATGKLAEILKQPTEEVEPGQILARVRIAEASDAGAAADPKRTAAAAPARPPASQEGGEILSPAVRRLLNEHALSAHELKGSGRNGRITVQDIERHVDQKRAAATGTAATATAVPGDADTTAKMRLPPGIAALAADGRRVPHSAVRRRVAEHMARSLAQAPHVTTLFEADLTRVQAHRARHAPEYERQGVRLTLTAYFVAACARALIAHPSVNATFHEDALELHPDANIGVGTALGDEGLIVPVIHQAQHLSLAQLAARLGQLVGAARAGRLAPQDVRGGTFTISNHGVGGSLLAAPIVINQPQVAILGVGKVERRVCVVDAPDGEAIGVRTMCYLTLTIDHRAIDAFQANGFLEHVVKTLEHWSED